MNLKVGDKVIVTNRNGNKKEGIIIEDDLNGYMNSWLVRFGRFKKEEVHEYFIEKL